MTAIRSGLSIGVVLGTLVFRSGPHDACVRGDQEVRAPSPADTYQDLLYFGPQGIIIVRLHLSVDGKPFGQVWKSHVQNLFEAADLNDDGRLTPDEVEGARDSEPGVSSGVNQLLALPSVWQADSVPPDGLLSLEEFATIVRQHTGGPFQFPSVVTGATSAMSRGRTTGGDRFAERLWDFLDRQQDGQLDRDELSAASRKVGQIDFDGDGSLSAEELDHSGSPFGRPPEVLAQLGELPVVPLEQDQPWGKLIDRIQRHADALTPSSPAKPAGISPDVFSLAQEQRERFDADENGWLDLAELRFLLRHPVPQLELTVRLGKLDAGQSAVEVTRQTSLPDIMTRTSENGTVSVTIGDVQLELGVAQSVADADSLQRLLDRLFTRSDTDRNGYVERDEGGRSSALSMNFGLLDQDGDGKLFRDEMQRVLHSRVTSALCRLRLIIVDRGQDLWEILDRNRDGLLGEQELRGAAGRLTQWDRDGDGALRVQDVPHLYQLIFDRGTVDLPGIGGEGSGASVAMSTRIGPSAAAAPQWFDRMDRNRDGVVSVREFIGTARQYAVWDRDGDGVIDLREVDPGRAPP